MAENNFTIRVMTRQEVDLAVNWAALEGWNPGLFDADSFYDADKNGFLIGLIGDEPVASISVVKYDNSFGFLGFYIVRPEYRGKGYGIQIWNAGLVYLNGVTVGLDGVIAQQDNYRKSGFNFAYRNIRYKGITEENFAGDKRVVPLSSIQFDEICSYDQLLFPANRGEFLKRWINQPQSTALGIVVNKKIAGYGVIRTCRSGYKIGPLFADNPEFADILFNALAAQVPVGSSVFLDTPELNKEAIALAERYHMETVFETARMYKGESLQLPVSGVFGVTSFELG